jgi:hypothetical protein
VLIAVLRAVADKVLRARFSHLKAEAQLNQRDRAMVSGLRADRQPQAVSSDGRYENSDALLTGG